MQLPAPFASPACPLICPLSSLPGSQSCLYIASPWKPSGDAPPIPREDAAFSTDPCPCLSPWLFPSQHPSAQGPASPAPSGQRGPPLPAGTHEHSKWVLVGRKEVLTEQRPPSKLCPHAGCPCSGPCLLGWTPPGWAPCGLTATLLPARAIGQHLVRWVGRGRGEGRPSGNMTPKTKVSTVGQWALGTVACLLLLLVSSNSFFEVSPTPMDDANYSLSLPGVSREQRGPCHLQGAVPGIQGRAWQPGPLVAHRSASAQEPSASQAAVVWG